MGESDCLPRSEIGCAANDLERLVRAEVDGGESQPIRIGMLLDRCHPSHDNLIPICAAAANRFDLRSGHTQAMSQFLDRQVPVDVAGKPLERDIHQAVPRNWSNSRRKRTSLR